MALHLVSLNASAGYLEEAPIEFGSELTCIIGARGTCKSTIVELVRFAFDCDRTKISQLLDDSQELGAAEDGPSSRGLIRAALQGGTVSIHIVEKNRTDSSNLVIERSVGGPPRVFRDGVKEIANAEVVLRHVEIYSQGDLQKVAEDGSKRLELIDQPNRKQVDELKARRDKASSRLSELGPRLRSLKNDMDARRSELVQLNAFRTELVKLQKERPKLSQELAEERVKYQQRQTTLESVQQYAGRLDELVSDFSQFWNEESSFTEIANEIRSLNFQETKAIAAVFQDFASTLSSIRDFANRRKQTNFEELLSTLAQRFEKHSARYFQLMKEQQQVTESIKREDGIKRQIQHLTSIEKQFANMEREFQTLADERRQQRLEIEQLSDELYSLRLEQVDRINEDFGDVVILTLHQSSRSGPYRQRIEAMLQGSRIRNQDEVAIDLAEKIRPSDLVDIVETGNSGRLAEALGRDMGQMARLVSFLADSESLYDLESEVFEDSLEITMFVTGVPKPLAQLSRGQMATALLPLILRSANYPLIFDQPEDDLDNGFIYETLVKKILQLKEKRQLIFVTHNANIPVLGEADKIIVMQMQSPTRAAPPKHGSVDEEKDSILEILEGGATAFAKRQERYADLL